MELIKTMIVIVGIITQYNAEAYNNKGLALTKLGQYQEAIENFNLAISSSDYRAAYRNKEIALKKLRQHQEATAAANHNEEVIRHIVAQIKVYSCDLGVQK
ncbi:tetratricopeptide repeat family protein [Orientia chuto str. Dubai]|uniref:Tetratricopeptide repeat family protein n=1 Tax=Orientia chuto str. Dubai TaxID=1359168 RepID=A0A0F3MKY7_9RICK|nr:tetratricopeptide repeat protein [Candidatus Orientia mediorientalis]KJV55254.1 tetratricopeptide repeat family protein [Orientia chuto str. Dubai]